MRISNVLLFGTAATTSSMAFSSAFVLPQAGSPISSGWATTTGRKGNTIFPPSQHHLKPQRRLFMNIIRDIFGAPQIASPEEIKAAFRMPRAVAIDVRSPGEITRRVQTPRWINAPGTPLDCPDLSRRAEELLPDRTAPVIVYCASGKRAQKAVDILKERGYQNVWNAGGIASLEDHLPIVPSS